MKPANRAISIVLLLILTSSPAMVCGQGLTARERANILIENTGGLRAAADRTSVDAGPAEGDMLNYHFFPGLQDYGAGMYTYAERQMTYVIDRPDYLAGNPRASEFLSTAHYIRGMVYAHHAKGIGARNLARTDFEAAIRYNARNYPPYFELSRLYMDLGFKQEAEIILTRVVDLNPDEKTLQEAQKLLADLKPGASK